MTFEPDAILFLRHSQVELPLFQVMQERLAVEVIHVCDGLSTDLSSQTRARTGTYEVMLQVQEQVNGSFSHPWPTVKQAVTDRH